MTQEELEQIIEKYRKLSGRIDDDEVAAKYEQFAYWVETGIDTFDHIEDKKELWELFLSDHDEAWEEMFPNGDEDDEITDYFTKD